MNDITLFESPQFGQIRTLKQNNEPWFIAADVCHALEIVNTTDAIKRLDDDEKARFNLGLSGGTINAVNEYGLYNLILASRKPEAKQFKRWITHDVLPAIRKDGGYIATQAGETDEQIMAKAYLIAQKTIERQSSQIKLMQPKVVFADAVDVSHTNILVGDLAKILKQNGVDVGANRLFDWMRKNGFLIRREGMDYNMPTQYSMEQELFAIKETTVTHADGHTTISKTPKVTGKGQIYFVNKFLNRGGRQ